ncbi:O-antigen ligase family protein [Calidifontibacillus oryziterrae]|uniref:O-antigen ligase family protein n=1 Tax=Calidifontibacillus oryziterrae TaxID=1191699 RepID=UPI0002D9C716|nr:O-antigen ligase family protein [Calidifontibacillus oryziterrae]
MGYDKYYKKVKIEKDKRDQNIDLKESVTIDKTIYILLLTALLIVPLFIKAHIFEYVSPKLTFLSSGMQADIFSYYKYIILAIITVIIGILFIYKIMFLQYEIKKSYTNLFIGILAVVVILSAIFSPYKSLALHGMYNRHEGTLTFMCYFALFFVAANMKFSVKQMQGFLYTLYPFVIINMILGLALFNEKDLLEVGWITSLILGSIPEGAQVSEGAKLWATVSNPNYISGIGSVMAVLFLTWAIFDKNKIRSAVNVVVALMSFVTVLTSFSTSGFLTMLVLLPIVLILIFLHNRKIQSFVVLSAFIVLATSVYVPMVKENPRVWRETLGFMSIENPFEKQQATVKVENKNEAINYSLLNKQIEFNNVKNSNELKLENGIRNVFHPYRVYAEDEINNEIQKFEIPVLPERGRSSGSGREYIWEKTFETAMKRPIFGYGLDTFTYVFPQDEIDKISGLNKYNVVVDKPHNLYLGLLIGSGIIALLVFVLLVASVLLNGARFIWNREKIEAEIAPLTIAFFTASIAYLIQGLVNDSVVGSAVIFWILLGAFVSAVGKRDRNSVPN